MISHKALFKAFTNFFWTVTFATKIS